jgi:repressor LexA
MPQPLNQLESQVYQFLIDFLAENTYQPSIREIARQFSIKSTKTVSDLLHALQAKGYIERDHSRSRGVRILGFAAAARTQPVPYYGQVHAGTPALLDEHRKGFITMDRRFLPCDEVFFLRVEGDSMIGRGIMDGDYVLVSPAREAEPGDVVAARLGDKATIKTLRQDGKQTVLEPANPADQAIRVKPTDDFAVLGVLAGVFRPFNEADPDTPIVTGPSGDVPVS